jgi:hypothetical protein
MIKEIELPRPACQHDAGKTSYTGTSVLYREQINRPTNENLLRGLGPILREDLRAGHQACLAAVPYELVEKVFLESGGSFIDEEAV